MLKCCSGTLGENRHPRSMPLPGAHTSAVRVVATGPQERKTRGRHVPGRPGPSCTRTSPGISGRVSPGEQATLSAAVLRELAAHSAFTECAIRSHSTL
jgi:hypothetical protein